MKEIDLNEIHSILLNILSDVDLFCKSHKIHYSLGGGTLLGAIRHKGFIPWDDDIDIMMPRPDYDEFIRCYNNYSKIYRCVQFERTEDVRCAIGFAKVHDPRTYCDAEGSDGICTIGINIDVFPIDGMPKSKELCLLHIKIANFLRMQLVRSQRKLNFEVSWKSKLMLIVSKFLPCRYWDKILDKYLKLFPYNRSQYSGAVIGRYGLIERHNKDTFESYIDVPFESYFFSIIANYDTYLKQHYGNYMSLPPENKRISHKYYAYWKM